MDQVVKLVITTGAYPAVCIGIDVAQETSGYCGGQELISYVTSPLVISSYILEVEDLRRSTFADLLNGDFHGGVLCLRAPHIFSKEFRFCDGYQEVVAEVPASLGGTLSRQWQLRD